MNNLPEFESYGQYDGAGYGLHTLKLLLPGITLWYSYNTIVAYRVWDQEENDLVVSENVWSATTGKHLTWIDGGNKKGRVNNAEFGRRLAAALARHGLEE